MSLKDEKISFSDQISSRLHRWVQRTTIKVRNEKTQNVRINHEENGEVISESRVNKSTPREQFATRSRDSRSYEELEKALNDLMINCVTSSCVSQEGNDNANINITRENNNNMNLETGTKTNCKNVGEFVSPSGSDYVQEKEENCSGASLETNVEALPRCEPKQSDVGESLTRRNVKGNLTTVTVNEKKTSVFSLEENEGNIEHKNEDFNNFSKPSDSCEINSSSSNVNKGLHTPIDRLKSLKTPNSQDVGRRLEKKPPLRRIQSEGDALELKFNDNDVTEFAATCIRHAQKKRFSDTAPGVYGSVDKSSLLSKKDFAGSELESSFESSTSKENEEKLERGQMIPEISFDQVYNETDRKQSTKPQHVSLSQRPSSLSFPLETPKHKNKSRSLKNKVFRHSPSATPKSCPEPSVSSPPLSVPISPRSSLSSPSSSRSTPSPKFRRFPCQPVFYVPKPNESRTSPNTTRSGSVGEQSKEYLI
jgi:hypothetical protein